MRLTVTTGKETILAWQLNRWKVGIGLEATESSRSYETAVKLGLLG